MAFARIAPLLLIVGMSGAGHARTIGQSVPLSVAFWDRDHGLAAFVRNGPTNRSEGYVSVTADGGQTWTVRWRGTGVSDIATVPGTRFGWAEIWPRTRCVDCPVPMIRTDDGGRTWHRAGGAPSMPSFPSPRIGFAMTSKEADAGNLMKTTDAGRTWRRVGSPCRRGWGGYAWAATLSFVSPGRGWVLCTGQPGAGSQSKGLYMTATGGRRWKRLLNAHFEPGRIQLGGLQESGYAHGISFARSGNGLLWGSRGFSLQTADGGLHWRRVSATFPEEREAWSGSVVSDRVAYLLVHDTAAKRYQKLLRTADGGRTWMLVRAWPRS